LVFGLRLFNGWQCEDVFGLFIYVERFS